MSQTAESGGWVAYFSGLLAGFFNLITYENINGFITILLGIGGLIFIFYNIRNKRLDTKLKQRELDKTDESK